MKRLSPADTAGVVVLLGFAAWSVASAFMNGRTPRPLSPYLTSPLFVLLGVVLGRWLARSAPRPAASVGALLVSAATFLCVTLRPGAAGGPLGYANANAALAVQLTALVALIALGAQGRQRRMLDVAITLAAATVILTKSLAAGTMLLPLLGAVVLTQARRVRRRWWSVGLGVASIATAAATVTWLAVRPTWPDNLLARELSETRRELWRDALRLWWQRPVVGSGPGSFAEFNPLAKSPDLAPAHMSLFQIGAETGLIGVALLAAIVGLAFAKATRGRPPATLVAAVGLSALMIHSFVDHLLEFSAVVLVAGLVVGWTSQTSSVHAPTADPTARPKSSE